MFFSFELWLMTNLMKNLLTLVPDPTEMSPVIAESVKLSWIAFGTFSLLVIFALIAAVLVLSHRFYGPMVALRKHVTALAQGDYAHRTHLRKKDEFKDLAAELNQLSEKLEGREQI
jgi:signal transduction histidine kinase